MSDDMKLDHIPERSAAAAKAAEESFQHLKEKLAGEVHKHPAVAITWDPSAPPRKRFQLAVMDAKGAHGGREPDEAMTLADVPDELMALSAIVKLLNAPDGAVEGDSPVKAFGLMGRAMYSDFLDRKLKKMGTFVPGNDSIN